MPTNFLTFHPKKEIGKNATPKLNSKFDIPGTDSTQDLYRSTWILIYWSIASCAFLVLRSVIFPVKRTFLFLIWNLILAWAPFIFSYVLVVKYFFTGQPKKIFNFIFLFFLWFIFFPNSLYVITDFIHLTIRKDTPPLWFDFILIALFSWTSLLLGYYSLSHIQKFIQEKYGAVKGWCFIFIMLFLSSFAIYLGRFLRWNSWDVITNPLSLFVDVMDPFLRFGLYVDVWIFCGILWWIFSWSYWIFRKILE